jgi:hypothetical protein
VATVADLLDTRVFYKQDGRSAFSEEVERRTGIAVRTRNFAHVVRIGLPALRERRARNRRRWARLFGTGAESLLLYGDPWTRAYRIGPHRELLDRRVSQLRVGDRAPASADLVHGSEYAHVSRHRRLQPTRVIGELHGIPIGRHPDLVLAVNGRIQATGRSFDLTRKRLEFFSLIYPEAALRPGRNRLELFEVRAGGELVPVRGV